MTRIPPGFRWVTDHDFLWVAAGEFLLALGVREKTVRPLGQLRPIYEKWEQAEKDLLGPAAGATTGVSLHLLDDRQRDGLDDDIAHALAVLVPIAEETLHQLDRQRIRPEILGYRRESLDGALADLCAYTADEGWRGKGEAAIEEHLRWIESRHRMETPPAQASAGEVRRIVAILRRMPRGTLRRITKVTSTPALMALVGSGLATVRSSGMGSGGTQAAPGGDASAASAATAVGAGVGADGSLGSSPPPAPSAASMHTSSREPTYDHRWSLIAKMSLVGIAPTVIVAGLLVMGAGMLMTGAVTAVVGIVALVMLTVMAFGGDSSASARQQALRSNTAGGMLAAWGTWNFGVGLLPLIYALVEEGSVITAVLGGILTVTGAVLGIVGSVQRAIARRRADLSTEDYDIPVGMVP